MKEIQLTEEELSFIDTAVITRTSKCRSIIDSITYMNETFPEDCNEDLITDYKKELTMLINLRAKLQ